MAKRTSNRSQANDGTAAPPAQPKARRSKAAPSDPDTIAADPDVERSEHDDATRNAGSGDQQPTSAMSIGSGTASSSMGSEPSDEDIRMRAYQRYLERGGSDGADFEDWLAAERELKRR
jgi:DUF2934 family protein